MSRQVCGPGQAVRLGNGGSLRGALHITVEFNHPIIEKRKAFRVIPLMTDMARMTAIGNDFDFTRVFVNQLWLFAAPGDIAMAFITGGKSLNVVYAPLHAAREKQLMTIAFASKDGWRFPVGCRLLLHRALLQHPPHPGGPRYCGPYRLGPRPHRLRRGRCHLTLKRSGRRRKRAYAHARFRSRITARSFSSTAAEGS